MLNSGMQLFFKSVIDVKICLLYWQSSHEAVIISLNFDGEQILRQ